MSFSHCLALLEQLSQVFDQLETLEREKAAAVGAQDLERLDQCMKQEQAVSLTLRVGGDDLRGRAGAGHHCVQHLDLFRGNFSCHSPFLLFSYFV